MRLGGEVHERVDAPLHQQVAHRGKVPDVALHEAGALLAQEIVDAGEIARVGERIEHDHAIVRMRLAPVAREIRADEAGATRDEHVASHDTLPGSRSMRLRFTRQCSARKPSAASVARLSSTL